MITVFSVANRESGVWIRSYDKLAICNPSSFEDFSIPAFSISED